MAGAAPRRATSAIGFAGTGRSDIRSFEMQVSRDPRTTLLTRAVRVPGSALDFSGWLGLAAAIGLVIRSPAGLDIREVVGE